VLSPELTDAAHKLWRFHNIECRLPSRADFILALGSHDLRVAECAGALMNQRLAPFVVTAGGLGKVTTRHWQGSEAERFAAVLVSMGVPEEAVIVEPASRNTGENITLARQILQERGIPASSGILVTKPYMRYRALATAQKQWAEVEWFVTSPNLSFDDYPNDEVPSQTMVELMVGDLQRMAVYAQDGLQVPVEIPEAVWEAYETLVAAGFDRFVIRDAR
jgi:uncharacterized SAM-binding protein YcdF (DUF218 family)